MTKAKKQKLHIFEIRWHAESNRWVLMHEGAIIRSELYKETMIDLVARTCARWVDLFNQHSELRIRNKNGRYAPARTYPRHADPNRSKR